MEIPYQGTFGPKHQNCHFKLKCGTFSNSSKQNSMVLFILSVFDWKYPFWVNLVRDIKIISRSWNLVARLIQICRIQWCCSFFFVFEWKYSFWPILVQKFKIVTLSWNLVPTLIWTCEIQWSCSFFFFWVEIPFWGKLGPKHQNSHFKLKFGTDSNSSIKNSKVMLNPSVFDWKCPFWANLVQKVKLICLSWNLVPTLIRTCRIQWWCSFFLFLIGNTLFGQIWSKKSKLSL